jgi:hypothetical protein
VAELGSLGLKVTGDADVEPAMELGGQIKQFDSHSLVLFKVPAQSSPTASQVTLRLGVEINILYLADRFQYLSVNVS